MIKDSKVNKTLNDIINGVYEDSNINLFTIDICKVLYNIHMNDEDKINLICGLSRGEDGVSTLVNRLLKKYSSVKSYYSNMKVFIDKSINLFIHEDGVRINKYNKEYEKRIKRNYKKFIHSDGVRKDYIKKALEYEIKNILFLIRGF